MYLMVSMNPMDGMFISALFIPEWSVVAHRKSPSADFPATLEANLVPPQPLDRRLRTFLLLFEL